MAARPAGGGQPPGALFWASQLLFGAAAGVLVMALAGLFAMPELTQYYSQIALSTPAGRVRLIGFSLIAAAIVAAGVGVGLGVVTSRGRRTARVADWVFCGVCGCAAIAVLVLRPWAAVPWLPVLLQTASAGVAVLVIAVAALLAQPACTAFYRSKPGADHDEPGQLRAANDPSPTPATPPGAAASQAPAAATPAAPHTPAAGPADFDPFT